MFKNRFISTIFFFYITATTTRAYLNVKDSPYNAKGDGTTDDTVSIQNALNAAGSGLGGRVVYIPTGTFMINALHTGFYGVSIPTSVTLYLSSQAILKAFPSSSTNYGIIFIGAFNVTLLGEEGSQILGERSSHTGTGGEWGMGVWLYGPDRVTIKGVRIAECWGDGIYIGSNGDTKTTTTNVIVENVICDHNRRQGMSLCGVTNISVDNCTFSNTIGTLPECGIDIEPNEGEHVINAQITNCKFYGNNQYGIMYGNWLDSSIYATASSETIVVKCCTFHDNLYGGIIGHHSVGSLVENNFIYNEQRSISIGGSATGFIIKNNVIYNNTNEVSTWREDAIYIIQSDGAICTNNYICTTSTYGIGLYASSNCNISNNKIYGLSNTANGVVIYAEPSTGNIINSNTVSSTLCSLSVRALPAACGYTTTNECNSGDCCDTSTGKFRLNTYTCRATNGLCDVAEKCTGSSSACPNDSYQSDTTVCRESTGICDPEEYCTGVSTSCPNDIKIDCAQSSADCPCPVGECCTGCSFKPSTYTCRVSTSVCDPAEKCTGTSAACPADEKTADGTSCTTVNNCQGICNSGNCIGQSCSEFLSNNSPQQESSNSKQTTSSEGHNNNNNNNKPKASSSLNEANSGSGVGKLSTTLIAVIFGVGGFILLCALIALAIILIKRRKSNNNENNSYSKPTKTTTSEPSELDIELHIPKNINEQISHQQTQQQQTRLIPSSATSSRQPQIKSSTSSSQAINPRQPPQVPQRSKPPVPPTTRTRPPPP